jgi:hypothetical protein
LADGGGLLERCSAAEKKAVDAERKVNELRQEYEKVQQQLVLEANNCLSLKKDNTLLRAQIADMSGAQEPLREEKYYILEFSQIGMDIDSWAAKETRTMSKQPLSESDSLQLLSSLHTCGAHGTKAAEWFGGKDKRFFEERRNRIALIRHVTAIVLFDRVFDRFALALKPEFSEYLKSIEKELCTTGFLLSGLCNRPPCI